MKKTCALIACILLIACIAAGCGAQQSVLGTWRTMEKTDRMALLDVEEETWIFNDDGTVVTYWDGEEIKSGRYEVEDDTVTVVYFGEQGPVFTLDGNELKENGVAVLVRHDENATE